MTIIELTTVFPVAPARAFDVSIDVDAHTASMSGSGERTVGGVRSGPLALNDSVTFTARHFGLPWRMTSRITEYDRPTRFVDEQARGPFAYWRHEHVFVWDESRGVTVARDKVEFAAPLGFLGRLVTRLVLEGYMRRLLSKRNEYLASSCTGEA
ncbi:SRPBCC family protein [Couchioplanes caeruleus]|uniref:Cyclase n=2 Tax=Couchioplanes caeruleus TaxID=56438 RepID=A0A1K0GEC7_9ACTN|nr:SRPBCC family protein [Couchioplanes caeruleus]OJF10502.1 hypothetical protein BG844_31240 [Couchioplanes caeruleus subsp. caeruleus]ROP28587.1 hypothetical protein EDD30_1351 [Couchioplanes caeruleus]